MNKYSVAVIADVLTAFKGFEVVLQMKRRELGDIKIPDDLKQGLGAKMAASHSSCQEITFIDCQSFLRTAAVHIEQDDSTTLGMAQVEFTNMREGIMRELAKWQFVPVSPDLGRYFEQPKLFGENVDLAFPDARDDIRQAGNCIAIELSTAAVFHLMRVAEYGLRRLAKQLRVQLTHSGKAHPIEFAEWEKVITGCKNKITAARALNPGSKRQAQLERYSDAADHCMFMKDIWRNTVSHARKQYTPGEAIGVLDRVRDFMGFLAV